MSREKKIRKRQFVVRLLQALSFARSGRFDGRVRSIAILVPERYGDCILLTKLLRQLNAALPDASIDLIVFRERSLRFFRDIPYASSIFYVKEGVFSWLKYFLTHRFDVLFDPKDTLSVSFLVQSALLRARLKVAHRNDYHEGIFDRFIDLEYLSHVTERNAGLLDVLGLTVPDGADVRPVLPPLPVGDEIRAFCEKIGASRCIGINLSAGSAARYWTREKWAALAGMFPEERFVVFSGPEDLQEKKLLEASLDNVIESPPTKNLGEVGAILQRVRMLVTPDTSLVHMAACFDTPVVALFHNDIETWTRFAPLSTNRELVISDTNRVGAIPVDAVAEACRKVRGRCD